MQPAPSGQKFPKPINYVFIDYENVKADGLDLLDPQRFHVVLFCGEHQKTIPISVSQAQSQGLLVEIVSIEGRTKEALDLHIAFYLGRLVSTTDATKSYFLHIVSRDKGFDSLVTHLISRNYIATRANSVMDLPLVRNALAKTLNTRLPLVLDRLQAMGDHRPARLKTLTGTIRSLFPSDTPPSAIEEIITALQRNKVIKIDSPRVSYPDNCP